MSAATRSAILGHLEIDRSLVHTYDMPVAIMASYTGFRDR